MAAMSEQGLDLHNVIDALQLSHNAQSVTCCSEIPT